jgi:hypothetical protein
MITQLPRDPAPAHVATEVVQLPAVYLAADRASIDGQRLAIGFRAAQLIALVFAAVLGAIPASIGRVQWGALVDGVLFGTVGLVEATILTLQPDRSWYQGRAVAESVKSLAWRYAVGGQPFPRVDGGAGKVDALLGQRLRQILTDFQDVHLAPLAETSEEITHWMRSLRASALATRKRDYQKQRIESQRTWYATKALWNQRRSVFWSIAMLAIQSLGIVGAILKGAGLVDLRLVGILAAVAASALAWVQIKQHATLAQSYSHAAHELSAIDASIASVHTEADWATFVDDAESAISREHMAWQAKRS